MSKWTGDCFIRSSLRHTGLTLYLGHNGSKCVGLEETAGKGSSKSFRDTQDTVALEDATCSSQVDHPAEPGPPPDPHVDAHQSVSPTKAVDFSLSHCFTDTLSLDPSASHAMFPSQLGSSSVQLQQTDVSTTLSPSQVTHSSTTSTSDATTQTNLHQTDQRPVETGKKRNEIPRGFDQNGNPWLTIVDITGVHHLPMHACICVGCSDPVFVQLLRLSLYPCTTERPRTVFTFRLLEDFDLENLETKASAQSFYTKLRRITNNISPQSVPDRYRELMRVLREWRNLMSLKRMGYGHTAASEMLPPAGGLALFCPACPQPEVNLPTSWVNNASE